MELLCLLFIDVLCCFEAVSLPVVSPFLLFGTGAAVVGAAAPRAEASDGEIVLLIDVLL